MNHPEIVDMEPPEPEESSQTHHHHHEETPPSFPTNTYSRRTLSKRGALKKLKAINKKADILLHSLNFVPHPSPPPVQHEKLLRRLGLWDFANIHFGKSVNAHLVAQLIVSYDPAKKCGCVNAYRINVNRSDLARALKLPLPGKKDRDLENLEEEMRVSFVEEFVMGWVVLCGEGWVMPSEIESWMGLIKSGHPEKVDWASLLWNMVEAELKQGVQLESCYYAPHLQCLIKFQREVLLREESRKVEVEEVKEGEELVAQQAGKLVLDLMEVQEDVEVMEVEEAKDVVRAKEDEDLLVEQPVKVELKVVEVEESRDVSELKEDADVMEVKEDVEVMEVKADVEVMEVKEDVVVMEVKEDVELVEVMEAKAKDVMQLNEDEINISRVLRKEPQMAELKMEEVHKELSGEEAGRAVIEEVHKELSGEDAGRVMVEEVHKELSAEEAGRAVVEEVEEDKELSWEDGGKVSLEVELNLGVQDIVEREDMVNKDEMKDNIAEKEEMKEYIMGKEDMKFADLMDIGECNPEKQGNSCLYEKNYCTKYFLQPCTIRESVALNNNEGKQIVEQVEENMKVEEEGDDTGSEDSDERRMEVEQFSSEEGVELFEVSEDEVDDIEVEGEEEELEEKEKEEDEMGCDSVPNFGSLHGAVMSGDLHQGFGTSQVPLNVQGQQIHDPSPMELFASNADTHLIMGGPSIFGSGHKRVMDYEEQGTSQLNGSNKRTRTTVDWDDDKSFDFGFCLGQVEQLMEKAKTIYDEKEQVLQELNMNQLSLLNELQERDNLIQILQKRKNEEVQKKEVLIFRLEREICLMGSVLDGYRKSLNETNKAFFDYRQRCQLAGKPIYKDTGPGGLVLNITELKKQRENQDIENMLKCSTIEKHVSEALEGYAGKFQALFEKVQDMDTNKLQFIENEVKLLKELSAAKHKASATAAYVTGD